jgi:hypothetical protein
MTDAVANPVNANPNTVSNAPLQNKNGQTKSNPQNANKSSPKPNKRQQNQERNGNRSHFQGGGGGGQNFEGKPRNPRRGGKKYNNREDQDGGQGGGEVYNAQPKTRALKRYENDVNWLRGQFNYISDEILYKTLEQNNFNAEQARQQLQAQKEGSWSNKLFKSSSLNYQYQTPIENYPPPPQHVVAENPPLYQENENYQPRQKQPPKYRKAQSNAQEPVVPKEEEYNADEKIEAIQSALEIHLSAMEDKAEKLKRLQEDIRKIKSDRDVKIESLTTEKEQLVERSQQLEQEIIDKKNRIFSIDAEVTRLKLEKVQKIRLLEEECRTLLESPS